MNTKELYYPSYGRYHDGDTDYMIENKYIQCEHCLKVFDDEEVLDVDGKMICKKCFDILDEEE